MVLVTETGSIQPLTKVDVKSKVAGRLISVPIVEGQQVHAGQLIALVDRTLIDPQIATAQAVLNQSTSALEQAEAEYQLQIEQTRDAIEQAQAGLVSAKTHLATVAAGARDQEVSQQQEAVRRAGIALVDADRTLARKKSLLARGFVPQADVDTAQVADDTARSNQESAKAQLSLTLAGPRLVDVADANSQVAAAKIQLATAETNAMQNELRRIAIDSQKAAVQQSRNSLAQLLVQLNDTTIIAPASGTVLKIYKHESEIIQSATTGFSDSESIVATLGNKLMVQVDINEIDIARVRLHQPVQIHVDALIGQVFNGDVIAISPSSVGSFTTGTATSTIPKYTVKIAIRDPSPQLLTGMTADVSVITANRHSAVQVPLEGISFTGSTGSVTVLDKSGKKSQRVVTLGLRTDTRAEVLSGLSPGDRVAVPAIVSDRRTIDINGGNN